MCRIIEIDTRRGGGGVEGGYKTRMPIRFRSYNIKNAQNGLIESSLRRMYQSNLNLEVLQETKIMYGVFIRGSDGYIVIPVDMPI